MRSSFMKGIRGSPKEPLAMLPKMLYWWRCLHLEDPEDGSDDEDDAEDKFENGDDWIGLLELQFQIEDFELLLQCKILGLELC